MRHYTSRLTVYIVVRAKFFRERGILRAAPDGGHTIAKFIRELDAEMAKSADTPHGNQIARTAPLWRSELNVVIPAHRSGAASAGSSSSGMRAAASMGATIYS